MTDVEGAYAVWENRESPICIKTKPAVKGGLVYVIQDTKSGHRLGGGLMPLELQGTADGDFAVYLEAMETVIQVVMDRYAGATADGSAGPDGPEFPTQPEQPAAVKATLEAAIAAKDEAAIFKLATPGQRIKADQILDIHALAKELRSNRLMNLVKSLRVESTVQLANDLVHRLLEADLDWRPRSKFFRGQTVKPTAGQFVGDYGRVLAVFPATREANVEFLPAGRVVKYAFDDLDPVGLNSAQAKRSYAESLALLGEAFSGPTELKPFDKEDWMGYGGAEAPEVGEGPLIGHDIQVGEDTGDIIADDGGVQIHLFSDDGDQQGTWHLDLPFKLAVSAANALCFHRNLTIAELVDRGFEKIG